MRVRTEGPGRTRRDRYGGRVPPGLSTAAAYAWRLIVVGAAVYLVFTILGRFQLIAVAVFFAFVVTAVVRPAADLLARRLPRTLAVTAALLGSVFVVLTLLALIGDLVASEWSGLGGELGGGVKRIEHWLRGAPFHLKAGVLSGLQKKIVTFISEHRSALLSSALSGAGRAVEVLTGVALCLFCSVFFIHSGERIWRWIRNQLPESAGSSFDRAGRAAWRTFSGYTRGIIIVAATNAFLVGIALFAMRVPLALPLTLLEFFATFIPLVGSPVALAVASVVALAGRGPLVAAMVLVLIVVIGQLEGHVLHPLVMSWAVRLHPMAVAISVIAGSIVGGVIGAVVAVPLVSVAWAVIGAVR